MISANPIQRTLRVLAVVLTTATVAAVPSWAEVFDAGALSPEIFALLQEARAEAGVPTFERTELLDGVAEQRAILVASLPHSEPAYKHDSDDAAGLYVVFALRFSYAPLGAFKSLGSAR